MTSECEVGVDPSFEAGEPQLVETRDLDLCERLVDEVCECGTAPQIESLVEQRGRGRGLACSDRLGSLPDEPFEAARVELVRLELEHVTSRKGAY